MNFAARFLGLSLFLSVFAFPGVSMADSVSVACDAGSSVYFLASVKGGPLKAGKKNWVFVRDFKLVKRNQATVTTLFKGEAVSGYEVRIPGKDGFADLYRLNTLECGPNTGKAVVDRLSVAGRGEGPRPETTLVCDCAVED